MRKNNNQTCLLHADQELEISFLPLIKGHAQLRTSSDPNATQSASVFKNGAVHTNSPGNSLDNTI